ncbi:MAG TPA: hypothetical protein VFK02_03375 [Kofleriaceae bacterium]|nr:hypothetical protein [Kofleriaceae bacterium]
MTACTRCEAALEDGDLRCAICALPVPSGARPEATRHAQVLRCAGCGAAVGFSAAAQAPRCGFCGQTMQIEQPIDPVEVARVRVPFAVDRDAAEAALRGWLARRGFFAPRELSREAVLDALAPLSWAAWRVNAEARVAWTADSDAGARRAAWAPHAGEVSLAFRDLIVPASRGLREAECQLLIPFYDLAHTLEVDPADRDVVERFDAQRSAARGYVRDAIEATAKLRVEPDIPGRRFRNVRVACLIERQTTERIALPVWVLAYRYRGAPYRAIVHGQRPEVVFGRSPIDWAKVGALAAALTVAAAILVVIAILVGAR